MSIFDWGWNSAWAERFSPHRQAGLAPARVVDGSRGVYELETDSGRVRGELAGRLEYAAGSALELPVAGDWVAITPTDPALMVHVVERQSLFTRVQDGRRVSTTLRQSAKEFSEYSFLENPMRRVC